VFENVLIDDGTQVVNVRNEEVLFALREEFVDETRVHDRVKEISVTGRVPRRLVFESGTGGREESFLVDTRVTRLQFELGLVSRHDDSEKRERETAYLVECH
jgi:hypothetical protein